MGFGLVQILTHKMPTFVNVSRLLKSNVDTLQREHGLAVQIATCTMLTMGWVYPQEFGLFCVSMAFQLAE